MVQNDARSAKTQERLIEVGLQLFTANGYAGTGLTDIAAESELTTGAIYHHFDSKKGLFRAIYEYLEQAAVQVVGKAMAVQSDPRQSLVDGVAALLDLYANDRAAVIALVEAPAVLGSDTVADIRAGLSLQGLTRAITSLRDSTNAVDGSEPELAVLLLSAMTGAGSEIVRAPDPRARRASFGLAFDQLINGMAGKMA